MADQIRLDGGGETLALELGPGPPRIVYWGETLPGGTDLADVARLAALPNPGVGFDDGEAFDLVPESGRGFAGHPGLTCRRGDGGFITQLAHQAVEAAGPNATRIDLADAAAGVQLTLEIELDAGTGVAGFRARLVNLGAAPLGVDWLSPAALPLPGDEALFFDGRWGREFRPARERALTGLLAKENRVGRTSHHAPPFAVVGDPGFGEAYGRVIGAHLAWSGDCRVLVERLRDGRLQLQAGELFWPGEMTLAPGEAYETPWLYAARSGAGLGGLSERLHPFVRTRILGGRLTRRPRPVHFNSWEAVYFRHDLPELEALAEAAAAVGAERFILDDGWFRGRNDDRAGLGDWTPDPVKWPDGLSPLIDRVRGLGMEFGLWVEPEMANADSDLLRAHPDWILGEPGRRQPLGRGQYVLDLTRAEVFDHVLGAIDALLGAYPIGYLKWDMNRDVAHASSGVRPASHRQTRAVYALIDALRAAHPRVEIESCSSGGGRADYEILKRTDRVWTSDCLDPIERQLTQAGFSIFFPPEIMGAHVGSARDHTTGRNASLPMRALTALLGSFGIEADIRAFSERDRAALKDWISFYKARRDVIHGGRLMRLQVADAGAVALMVAGEQRALATYAQLASPLRASPEPLRLRGLASEAIYSVRRVYPAGRPPGQREAPAFAGGRGLTLAGSAIETVGLPLPLLRAGEIALFELERLGA